MQHVELEVPEALQNSIRGFWYRGMDFATENPGFEVLPDGHAELIFFFGNLRHDDVSASPFLVSLLAGPIFFEGKGRVEIIGVKCLPWALNELLGVTPDQAAVQPLRHPIASLQPALADLLAQDKVELALVVLRDWFETPVLSPELHKAGKALLDAKGSLPVHAVAEAAHATVRTLERKFKASSGYTVKDVAALIRFEQVRDRLWAQPETLIGSLAHELGYADQSHLNREFKRYSGTTAGAFAKKVRASKK
ncbi:MAG: helix-turn-helix domain-containing protein [Mucilaginibacter sp.]|uniref:helix-turn-helix domain-containing protein n=1 Tax=Mucilaginibacter sp. TaxID=1882438 RepID=UPI0031A100F9